MTPASPTPILDIAAGLFWIAVIIGVWKWVGSLNRTHPALFNLPPALPVAPLINPCNHAYQPLDATRTFSHMFEEHFEIWNFYGEKNLAPATWRKHHAHDHGVRA